MVPDAQTPSFSALSRQRTILLSFVLVIVLALIDLGTNFINVPILFFIPIALCAKTGRRKPLIWLTVLVVVLTYGLYFIDSSGVKFWYRIINRTMVALGLC